MVVNAFFGRNFMNLLTKIIVANIFFSYTLVASETSLLLAKLNFDKAEKDYTEAYEECINLEKDNIICHNDIKNIMNNTQFIRMSVL